MSKKPAKKPAKKDTGLRKKYLLILNALMSEANVTNWPCEMKIAKKLWEKFPDTKFWEGFKSYRQIGSLTWILNPQDLFEIGKQFEQFKKDALNLSAPATHFLGDKIGEDRTDFKPSKTSLLEFLRK